MSGGRRRLLVSVEPRLLRDSLERLLDASGVDDVVAVAPGEVPEGTFDGAIVSAGSGDVDADIVIELRESDPGHMTLHTAAGDETVDLRDVTQIIDLLDEHAVGDHPRAAESPERTP